MVCHGMVCDLVFWLFDVRLCVATRSYVTYLCYVLYDMRCYVVLCYTMPCHAMPCHAMPCHAMPCYATLRHLRRFLLWQVFVVEGLAHVLGFWSQTVSPKPYRGSHIFLKRTGPSQIFLSNKKTLSRCVVLQAPVQFEVDSGDT